MKQYILKSALVVEIESKKKCAQYLGDSAINSSMQQFYDGMKQGCVDILSFLDTLEVKEVEEEPVSVWHNMDEVPIKGEVIVVQTKDTFYGLSVQKGGSTYKNRNKDRYIRWAYASDLLNLSNVQRDVKDLKCPVSNGLEEEIHRYYVDWDEHPQYVQTARHFAKWQKERMVDKACNFIYEQLNNGIMECGDIETFINDFKKEIEL